MKLGYMPPLILLTCMPIVFDSVHAIYPNISLKAKTQRASNAANIYKPSISLPMVSANDNKYSTGYINIMIRERI